MQTIVESNIRSKTNIDAELDKVLEKLKQVEELSFSHLNNDHVQRLFNYGMNACGDRELVKECLLALFVNIRNLTEPLSGRSVDSCLFKLFRGILIQQIVDRGKSSVAEIPENLFLTRTAQVVQHLTGLQREAMYLKFNSGLSYGEVSIVMDLKIDQVRLQVSDAVESSVSSIKQTRK